jgi:hypothetical protein
MGRGKKFSGLQGEWQFAGRSELPMVSVTWLADQPSGQENRFPEVREGRLGAFSGRAVPCPAGSVSKGATVNKE